MISIDLTAVFRLSQLAARQMFKQATPGKILNIASILSFQGGILVPSYAAAKGSVVQLTRAFANEWAAKGINVNAIAPGYMTTDNTVALRNDHSAAAKSSSGFLLDAGESLPISQEQPFFCAPLPAITYTAMFSWSIAVGSHANRRSAVTSFAITR